jgi:protein TonB
VVRDPAPPSKSKPEPVPTPDPPEPEVVLTRARYRSNPTPSYPDEARRQKQEGVVLLRVVVNEKGKVESADLLRTSGFDSLDDAALRGIRRWTFEPARRGEMPVQSTVNVPVRFKLD